MTDRYSEMMPQSMIAYLVNYGWHFNQRAVDFAASNMKKRKRDSKDENDLEPITPYTKEEVDEILKKHNIKLEHNQMCDYIYVANKAQADYLGSSIEDEKHLALHIKDEIDDVDRKDGVIMKMWYAMMYGNGIGIPWYELLD